MTLELYARAATLRRTGQVTDLVKLEAVLRHNAVGTWVLELDRNSAAAELMLAAEGLVIVRNGRTLLSGPRTVRQTVLAGGRHTLMLAGVDDTVWLDRRLALPVPAGPPYIAQAYDVRKGAAETVLRAYVDANLGPGATVPRRLAGLTLPADQARGAAVTGVARFQPLLEVMQELALAGGVGFRVVQVGLGLQLEVYLPADRTRAAVFSTELGNLAGYDYSDELPTATYAYVAGQGEGTARTIVEGGTAALAVVDAPVPNGYTFIVAAEWSQDTGGVGGAVRRYTNVGANHATVTVTAPAAGFYEVIYDADADANRTDADVSVDGVVVRRLSAATETGTTNGTTVRRLVLVTVMFLAAGAHTLRVQRVNDGSARFVSFQGFTIRRVDFRAEVFKDQRDTNDQAALEQSRTEALTEGQGTTSLKLSPIDTASVAYGQEYGLGDRVTVRVDGEQLQDVVREVKLTFDRAGEQVAPVVGTPGARDPEVPRLFDALHRLAQRQSRLERR